MATHWTIGHGLSGYLSGSDDVTAFLSWSAARDALVADMRDYADTDDDAAWSSLTMVPASDYPMHDDGSPDYGDDAPTMLATVESMVTDGDVAPFADAEWTGHLEDSDGRTIWFGLSSHDSSECDGMCDVVDEDEDEEELPDSCLAPDGHWYVITYGRAPWQIHATDCSTCRPGADED